MKISRCKFLSLAAIAVMSFSSSRAWSQSTNIVKLIVPFPAGGGLDILARLLAEQIGRTHGPSIVVENRPGAGTVIGTEAASRAAPDGNTLLFNTPNFVISPHLRGELRSVDRIRVDLPSRRCTAAHHRQYDPTARLLI